MTLPAAPVPVDLAADDPDPVTYKAPVVATVTAPATEA